MNGDIDVGDDLGHAVDLILDTNILSEVTKQQPDGTVLRWLDGLDEDRTFISVLSIAEISRGVALLDDGKRKGALKDWLTQDLPQRFEHRVLPANEQVARAWGDLMGLAKRCGRGMSSMDGLIAATAVAHNVILSTRNTKDFNGFGIELVDPWTTGQEGHDDLLRMRRSVHLQTSSRLSQTPNSTPKHM